MLAPRLKLAGQVLALLLVAGLVGLFVWQLRADDGKEIAADIREGKTPPAPGFTLPSLDGKRDIALSSFKGKVVVLNFWASWCVPCKREAPRLQQAWEKHGRDGLVVLGVDVLDFDADGRKFLRNHGVTYPNAHDGRGRVLEDYGGVPLPKTFFLKDGKVVAYIFGEAGEDELADAIRRALGTR